MRKAALVCVTAVLMLAAGCKNEKEQAPIISPSLSDEIGTVAGQADFATETPVVTIKDITTYLGEDIDYSSGVEILNTEQFEDFQMWVDASGVDIYTVGTYEAVYRFVYDGKNLDKTIRVYVVENTEEANEPSGDAYVNNNGNNNSNNGGGTNAQTNNNSSGGNNQTVSSAENNNNGGGNNNNVGSGNNNNGSSNNNVGSGNNNNNNNSGGGNKGTQPNNNAGGGTNPTQNNNSSGGNGQNTNQGGNTNNPAKETTTARRQMITSSGVQNTKVSTLGYMNIELLSGSVVKIKCTTSKYIISTRTEESDVERNGTRYRAYKLIIKYNTGEEQVLETYEEKLK